MNSYSIAIILLSVAVGIEAMALIKINKAIEHEFKPIIGFLFENLPINEKIEQIIKSGGSEEEISKKLNEVFGGKKNVHVEVIKKKDVKDFVKGYGADDDNI